MAKQHNIPLRSWVPYPMGIATTFVLMLTIMIFNGSYMGSSIDIAGSMGVLSEDISMAYYSTSAGMAVGYLLIPKIRAQVATKALLITDLILQAIIALICAKTQHMWVMTMCSFFIGVLKAFVMIELVIILKLFFSPSNSRSEFYAYFYPLVFGLGQVSMVLTAMLAYSYQWQYIYYIVFAMQLLAIMLVMICFKYDRQVVKIPLKSIDLMAVGAISAVLLLIIFAATYGKYLDWFSSPLIVGAVLLVPLLIWFFIRRQRRQNPMVPLSVLKSHKVWIGYLFMFIAMFCNVSSYLMSSFTTTVLKIDSVHSNELSLWTIPGFILGATLCYWWLKLQIWRFRVLVFWGMACFVAYYCFIYFGVTMGMTYEFLYIPTMLKGMGMMVLFIAFGVYAVEDLEPRLMIYNAFFLISLRSAIAPAVGTAFFTNMLYRMQQMNISVLGAGIDMQNPVAAEQYNQSLQQALAQGQPMELAQQIATNSLYGAVQMQALVVSIKQIAGWMLVATIIIMVIARFTPFHKTIKVNLPKTGEDMA